MLDNGCTRRRFSPPDFAFADLSFACCAVAALAFLGAGAATPRASAADSDAAVAAEELIDFTGREILEDLVVTTASKREQKSRQAPAVIFVITRERIERRGYRTVLEALRDVVGFDINDSGNWADMGFRGLNEGVTYGKHIQFLVDGHDMSMKQFYRNLIAPDWVAIDDIDRIEIIRGPGSAVWGANAMLGVVNIITTKPGGKEHAELAGTGGSYQTGVLGLRGGHSWDGGYVLASSSYYTDDTSDFRKIKEWSDTSGKEIFVDNDKESDWNVRLKAGFKDFEVLGHVSEANRYAPISTFSVGGTQTRFDTERKILQLAWNPSFGDATLRAEASYDDYAYADSAQYEDNPYNGTPVTLPPTSSTDHFIRPMAAADKVWSLNAHLTAPVGPVVASLGVEHMNQSSERWNFPDVLASDNLPVPEFDVKNTAGYFMADYALKDQLTLNAGLRYDYNSEFGGVANGRLGTTYGLPMGLYFKLLVGQGYKAPSLHELFYYRKNAFYGNPDLEPEKSTTGEVLVGYQREKKFSLSANYFYSVVNGVIGYQAKPAGTPLDGADSFPESQLPDPNRTYNQQENIGDYRLSGTELEAAIYLVDNLSITLGGTARSAENKDTGKRLDFTYDKSFHYSVSYFAADFVNIELWGRYVGDRPVPFRAFSEPGNPDNPPSGSDATLQADASFVHDLSVHVPRLLADHLSLTFKVANILDEEWYDAGQEVLYAQNGRSYFASLGVRY
ncbi:MAG: TonB-dependent receptor [Candidatus Schekmanbacteria bacterium]|nr:TonB-dependent receptor [Candidatus Schekmanbacteria bacterium]